MHLMAANLRVGDIISYTSVDIKIRMKYIGLGWKPNTMIFKHTLKDGKPCSLHEEKMIRNFNKLAEQLTEFSWIRDGEELSEKREVKPLFKFPKTQREVLKKLTDLLKHNKLDISSSKRTGWITIDLGGPVLTVTQGYLSPETIEEAVEDWLCKFNKFAKESNEKNVD